jgi:hypothetical protein
MEEDVEGHSVNTSEDAGTGALVRGDKASGDYDVDPARAALVKEWIARIKDSKQHHEAAFKRMDLCMQVAEDGDEASWVDANNYVVPIINRHINQAVSQLYAKNPTAIASRKERLMFQIWDGKPESLQMAMMQAQAGMQNADPLTGQPMVDPNAMALLAEVAQAQQQMRQLDQMGKTLQILWKYYMDEQTYGYKEQIKAAVRRTKVCGVSYFKLGFQRILEKRPDITSAIEDITSKIKATEATLSEIAAEEMDETRAEVEQLRLNLRDLEEQETLLVREGPVIDFPRAKEIIIDKKCRHLKTFAGAHWIAHEFDMSPREVLETYGVDIKGEFMGYTDKGAVTEKKDDGCAKVWEVQDKVNQQVFTVIDGYCDFIREPASPDVYLERFFNVFALVFNEIESETKLYPPSDVWLSRHIQKEYNRSREGLREHRIASKPYYVVAAGMEEADMTRLGSHAAHEVFKIQALLAGQKVEDLVQRGVTAPIDPNLYEVEMHFNDLLRTVGAQEATLGATSDSTATEASIAQNSQNSGLADNADDLDGVLTNLARAGGHLMLMELAKETVVEIVGPGAVWPDVQETRESVAKDLYLEIKAGSSGRPNRAADLANMERGMPFLIQLPGVPPGPLVDKYTGLLDLDLESIYVEGMPSIQALNAIAGRPPSNMQDPTADPAQQGPEGQSNQQAPDRGQEGPQPAYPAPEQGMLPL